MFVTPGIAKTKQQRNEIQQVNLFCGIEKYCDDIEVKTEEEKNKKRSLWCSSFILALHSTVLGSIPAPAKETYK